MSQQAIAPLGEAWSNVRLFGELARADGIYGGCFRATEDELIDQALAGTDRSETHGLTGLRGSGWSAKGQVALELPVNAAGEVLPFSTRRGSGRRAGAAS